MTEWASGISALLQVLFIDLVLAGDNAVVVGLAVAGLPAAERRRAVVLGIGIATVLRIVLATVTVSLLAIVGLVLAGGLLLLWVCWRMYRDLRAASTAAEARPAAKSLGAALWQIVVADVSMSLDNVLGVAGAARGHPYVLALGLVISVGLMGLAANALARVLERWRWVGWFGLAVVAFVALRMIWEGSREVVHEAGLGAGLF